MTESYMIDYLLLQVAMERQGWVVSVVHIDLMGVMMSHKCQTGRKNLYPSMSEKQQKKWHRKLSRKGNLLHI